MKFVDEYRDPQAVLRAAARVRERASRCWRIMEVCGGQTHSILESGLDTLLEGAVELLHGPGCPVCVTPLETLDRALALADRPDVTLVSFGDMLRVPGSRGDLFGARARGADVRVVYSPLDALGLARARPERQVVFLAVGFETTAPAVAGTLRAARAQGVENLSALVSHVRVPPALAAIRSAPECRVDGFLAAGHVCTVMGTREYEPIARSLQVPIVVTGFEPLDLLQGAALAVDQLERKEARVEVQYRRAVRPEGNVHARRLLEDVYRIVDRPWRGIGVVPGGGLALSEDWAGFDAERRFPELALETPDEPADCHAGDVLRGALRPPDCPAFGGRCTPEHPLGAPMVSSEGACAAYFRYRLADPTADRAAP
ncbi:MAG: hydrogenase formation protein HypD [Myxococcota bacterium]